MHVVQLTLEYPPQVEGGLCTHVVDLVSGLVERGVHVTVLAVSTTPILPPDEEHALYSVRWIHPVSFNWPAYHQMAHVVAHPELEAQLVEEIVSLATCCLSKFRPDLIHLHGFPLGKSALKLAATLQTPLVYTAHSSAIMPQLFGEPVSRLMLDQETALLQSADAILTPSKSMQMLLCQHHGADENQIRVVPNGLDIAAFVSGATGSRSKQPTIMFVGRFAHEKGITELIQSAALVHQRRPDVRYRLIGFHRLRAGDHDAPLVDEPYKKQIQDLGLADTITIDGYLPRTQLAGAYKSAHIAVVPSLYEPFGYAALEPMSLGIPVIASDTGGLAEIIEKDISGILVPLCSTNGKLSIDIAQLAEAQLRLLEDRSRSIKIGESGRQRAQAFTVQQMVDGVLAAYREL